MEVVLCQHGGVQVCGSFTREADLLDLLQRQPDGIDLLLIDLLAPYGPEQGLSLLRLLSRRWPLLPVLVLSAHCNASMVTMAMQAGARLPSKGTTPAMLRRAVEVLARGAASCPELRTQLNRSRMRRTPAPVLTPLSRREREVLRLVLQGCTTGRWRGASGARPVRSARRSGRRTRSWASTAMVSCSASGTCSNADERAYSPWYCFSSTRAEPATRLISFFTCTRSPLVP